jgi:hypothetical protein
MPASTTSVQSPKLRFVVATFETWPQLRTALRELHGRGAAFSSISYLALRPVFADTINAWPREDRKVEELSFPGGQEPICCSAGPIADALAERLRAQAPSLQSALSHWLIPRHAAHFQKAIGNGQIILWVQIFDADGEVHASQSLLASAANAVGVHDLVARQSPGPGSGA